jgi:hypothetical protein
MVALENLEKSLDGVFGKNAPKLPENGKNILVKWLPWITLVAGLLSLWAAYALWHLAHLASYADQLYQAFGINNTAYDRMSTAIWIGLVILIFQGVVYLLAYPGLRDRKKMGWNLLFYAQLVYIAYGVVMLFSDIRGGVGSLFMSLIGSVIGLWLLFQIRGKYKV